MLTRRGLFGMLAALPFAKRAVAAAKIGAPIKVRKPLRFLPLTFHSESFALIWPKVDYGEWKQSAPRTGDTIHVQPIQPLGPR